MARSELPIVALNTTTGLPVAGASVQVKFRSSGLNATWYTAETGGTSSTAAVTTDSAGRTTAWLDRGAYNCTISGTGITTYTEPWDSAPAADNAIDALWLPDNVIANRHLGDDVVTAAEIAAGAVGSSELAANAVVAAAMSTAARQLFPQLVTAGDHKIAWGSGAGSGFNTGTTFTVTHGMGATPVVAFAQPRSFNYDASVQGLSATTITIGVGSTNGVGSLDWSTFPVYWLAIT